MRMHTPPELHGQTIEHSFGADGDYAYLCVYDRSDRTTEWYRISWDDAWDATPDGEVDWDPVNTVPDLRVEWQPCAEPADEEKVIR